MRSDLIGNPWKSGTKLYGLIQIKLKNNGRPEGPSYKQGRGMKGKGMLAWKTCRVKGAMYFFSTVSKAHRRTVFRPSISNS